MFYKETPIFILSIFFFLTMGFASAFYEIKLCFYIYLISYALLRIFIAGYPIPRQVIYLLPWYIYFTFSLFWGVLSGYPVDSDLVNTYFIIPISAVLLAGLIDSYQKITMLKTALIVIALAICLLNLAFIINSVGMFEIEFFNSSAFGSAVISDSQVEFRTSSHPALIFLLPYVVVLYFYPKGNNLVEGRLVALTLLLSIFVVLLSGRRALQLVFVISLVLTYLSKISFDFKLSKNQLYSIVLFFIGVVTLVLLMAYFLDNENIFLSISTTFTEAFSTENKSGQVRLGQSNALISGFLDSPIIGSGLNSYVKDFIRSEENPWSYEMVYLALLFQTGLTGLIVFFSYCYKIAFANLKMYHKSLGSNGNFFLGIFAGSVAFIFAGSSNSMVYFIWFWSISLVAFNRL